MPKRVDDASALFRAFWPRTDGFREFNRVAEAGDAENRWPLMKSMALDKRVMPPPLSMRQKQDWLEQGLRTFPRLALQSQTHHSYVSDSSLSQVFGRIEGATGAAAKAKARAKR
jgi:hypothetical protein